MTTSRAFALSAAVILASCGTSVMQPQEQAQPGSTAMDQRIRDAMPVASAMSVATPDPAAQSSRQANPDSTVGDGSVFLADTVALGLSVNGGVAWTLGLLKAITDLPAASCDGNGCTWGPSATGAVAWELKVTANGDAFDYALSGETRAGGDGQFHSVISGSATPSGTPHRGSGSFSVDLDEADTLNPANFTQGKLQVSYSNAIAGQATVNATFLNTPDTANAGQSDNAIYAYAEDGQGGGSLQAAARNLTSGDTQAIDSRWVAGGAGRADVNVTSHSGQHGNAYDETESECWAGSAGASNAAAFQVVYFSSNDPEALGASSGNVVNCAFTTAAPTSLTAP